MPSGSSLQVDTAIATTPERVGHRTRRRGHRLDRRLPNPRNADAGAKSPRTESPRRTAPPQTQNRWGRSNTDLSAHWNGWMCISASQRPVLTYLETVLFRCGFSRGFVAMKCDDCPGSLFAIPNRDYSRCDDCGKHFFSKALDDPEEPVALSDEPVGVSCPKCVSELRFAELHDRWRVCFCENCRGFVIDSGCLGSIVYELRAAYQGKDADPVPLNQSQLLDQWDCPACHERMETHPYHGPGTAVINSCQGCRVTWLDHRELASIISAPGRRRHTTPLRRTPRRLTVPEAVQGDPRVSQQTGGGPTLFIPASPLRIADQ